MRSFPGCGTRWRNRLALVLITSLAGCSLGPDFVPPTPPVVDRYLPAGGPRPASGPVLREDADIPAHWWELFRSRPLNDLIEQALQHSPDLQAAEAAVRVAQANVLAQRGALFPQVGVGWNSSRQKVPTATLDTSAATGASIFSLHTPQVTVSFTPDVWGGVRRQSESLEAVAENQAFLREAVYLTLTSNVALAAIEQASQRAQITAVRRIIALQDQLLGLLRRQQELGQIALPDVLAQETVLAQARLLLPLLEQQLEQQNHLLARLTGRFPGNGRVAMFDLKSLDVPRALPLSLPADLVRQRPDIRAAEANVHAASAQVGVALANRFPQITLTGNRGSTADQISRLFTPGTGFWTIAGDVLQPVFDAGTLKYRQVAAEETLAQATAQYKSTVLTAFNNVADTLSALQANTRTLSAAVAAESAAARTIDLARRQIERGQVSLPVLIATQKTHLEASLAHIQAQAARLAHTVVLFQALGGGWWNRLETTVAHADCARNNACASIEAR